MIRRDIMKKLQKEDLDKIFLKHREGFDQGNYRVAEIDKEIVCWNPENGLIMDYFYDDDIDNEWFDLKIILPEMNTVNTFEINRDGVLRKVTKNSVVYKKIIYSSSRLYGKFYPTYSIPLNSNKKEIRFLIHRLLAKLFIPNINVEERTLVDHINRDIDDYSITNLRWVTNKENAKNKVCAKFLNNYVYEAYTDNEYKHLKFTLTEEELSNNKEFNKCKVRAVARGYLKDKKKENIKTFIGSY